MSAYDGLDERNNVPVTTSGSKEGGCCQTKCFQILLGASLVVMTVASIACCALLGVFHSHLMFLCSYAEFMTLIVLEGVVLIFTGYHAYHIYRFFAPAKEEEENREYGNVGEEEEEEEFEDENDFENSKPMKVLFFLMKVIGLLASLLAFAALVSLTVTTITIQQLSFPQTSGRLQLKGLETGATVTRDASGVIHISAKSEKDLFFAQGVAVAQERMFQLEFYRRFASGTLAEVFGAGLDNSNVNADTVARTLGFHRSAHNTWDNLPADVQTMISSYVAGINAYIATEQHVAPEFGKIIFDTKPQAWKEIDVVAVSKALTWQMALNVEMEVLRFKLLQNGTSVQRINQLYPVYPVDGKVILSAKDLNITATQEEIDALNKKFENDNGAYNPKQSRNEKTKISLNAYETMGKVVKGLFGSQKASNAWVVSGKFTTTKKPILANDPHMAFTAPGAFILMHLETPETGLNTIGASIVGIPGIWIGENTDIAWGLTNSVADIQDLYVMKDIDGNSTTSTSYEYHGQTLKYTMTNEVIKVLREKDVDVTVKESVYGPIVNNIFDLADGPSMSLNYPGFQFNDTSLITYSRIMRAKDWTTFTNALVHIAGASHNYLYADRNGSIGFATAGKIPVRKEGHSGRFPVPGTGEWDYIGYIPQQDLPIILDPSEGYIVAANNKITPGGYKYSITLDWESKYRAERIVSQISQWTPFANVTLEQLTSLQKDVKSLLFEEYKFIWPLIVGNLSEDAESWRKKLVQWDGEMSEGAEVPAIFEAWFGEMCKITEAEIGLPLEKRYPMFIREILKNDDLSCLKSHNMTCTLFAAYALNNSVSALGEIFGGMAPLWGTDVHEVQFNHLALADATLKCMSSKTVFNIGGSETVNVGDTTYPELKTTSGVTYRQVIDLSKSADEANDKFIIPLGQSGNWLSSSYDNYLYSWRAGNYLDMKFKFTAASTLQLVNE